MPHLEEPGDAGKALVVHQVFTQTSVYVSPSGEQFPYFNLICQIPGQDRVNLLFNPGLTVGILGDIAKMLKHMFGVIDTDTMREQAEQLTNFGDIDWDNLPPPPDDPTQTEEWVPPTDADYTGEDVDAIENEDIEDWEEQDPPDRKED